ncbi:MAG: PhzF family phenazine biosynthesis protein, partial [Candidatus Omnitrophica bacterium]|nr:PhzF family phenazine biosynthesis protein [Candidatus Omnitrophota bacterium]
GTLKKRGLVITASDAADKYVLRFFAPQSGIPEDPCTGSAQSVLADLWKRKNKRTEFDVVQLSDSGGAMRVICGAKYVRVRGRVRRIGRPEVSVK